MTEKCYKVVNVWSKPGVYQSSSCTILAMRKFYEIGKKTFAPKGQPLFVFDTLERAKRFVYGTNLIIFECECDKLMVPPPTILYAYNINGLSRTFEVSKYDIEPGDIEGTVALFWKLKYPFADERMFFTDPPRGTYLANWVLPLRRVL